MLENFKKDLKIIWFFLSKYKKEFYINFFMIISVSILESFIPFSYGKITDHLLSQSSMNVVLFWIFLLLFLTVFNSWMFRNIFVLSGRISIKCVHDFITLLNGHVMNLRLTYHNKNKSGKLSSRYLKAGDSLANMLESIVFWFAAEVLSLIFALLLIGIFIHWFLFIFIFINISVYLYVSYKNSKILGDIFLDIDKSYERAYGSIHDSVANIKLVKANSREKYQNGKVKNIFDNESMNIFEKFWKSLKKLFFLQDTIYAIMIVTSFLFLAFMFNKEIIGVGQIVAFVGYLSLIREPLNKMGRQIDHYRRWMATIRRGYSLLDEEAEDYSLKRKESFGEVKGEVEFRDMSFSYNETRDVLHDINLKIKPGEMIALVGESGVGKSTLMDLLSRYIEPSSGKIFIDGVDIQKVGLHELRSKIAIVPQEVSMFNDTLYNNIVYGNLEASEEEVKKAVKAANAEEFINSFPNGINEEVGERGVHLSGGQKQRVAIARAVLKDPKILILDEATSALDSKSEVLVQEALKELVKNRTTFVIAHRLSTIVHADKIIVLEKGRIVEQGKHEELLEAKGSYYKLYLLQTSRRNEVM